MRKVKKEKTKANGTKKLRDIIYYPSNGMSYYLFYGTIITLHDVLNVLITNDVSSFLIMLGCHT